MHPHAATFEMHARNPPTDPRQFTRDLRQSSNRCFQNGFHSFGGGSFNAISISTTRPDSQSANPCSNHSGISSIGPRVTISSPNNRRSGAIQAFSGSFAPAALKYSFLPCEYFFHRAITAARACSLVRAFCGPLAFPPFAPLAQEKCERVTRRLQQGQVIGFLGGFLR
jgi:hypothetical protein